MVHVHAGKCIFQKGHPSNDTDLSSWYSNKLQQIGRDNFKEYLHCIDSLGNTLLHAAVHAEDLDSLEFIVSLETVDLNVRNRDGFSPLFISLQKRFKPELARCLIEANCDVNQKCGRLRSPPLHFVAEQSPDAEVAHLLIKHGADINARDKHQNTALHCAVEGDRYDTVCMLLYYGADADEPNIFGATPFEAALTPLYTELQELLLQYVTDVNRPTSHGSTLLMQAWRYRSPCYLQLIDAGADCDLFDLGLTLFNPTNEVFKRMWARLDRSAEYEHDWKKLFFGLSGCELPEADWLECLDILLDSEDMESIAQRFYTAELSGSGFMDVDAFDNFMRIIDNSVDYTWYTLVDWFVFCFFKKGLSERALHGYVCRVLARGVPVYCTDLEAVCITYGYGETLRLLLQMDVVCNMCEKCPLPYLMCCVEGDESYFKENIFRTTNAYREYARRYFSEPRAVPRLVELARAASRRAVRLMAGGKSICQFYTVLWRLRLPPVVEAIIMYAQPIYSGISSVQF